MIIDSFDNSKPLIDPKKVVNKHIAEKYGFYPEVMILTFSENLIDELLRLGEIEIIGKDLALGAELEHLICRVKGINWDGCTNGYSSNRRVICSIGL